MVSPPGDVGVVSPPGELGIVSPLGELGMLGGPVIIASRQGACVEA